MADSPLNMEGDAEEETLRGRNVTVEDVPDFESMESVSQVQNVTVEDVPDFETMESVSQVLNPPPMAEQFKIEVTDSHDVTVAKEIHHHHHHKDTLDNVKARTKATLERFDLRTFFTTRAAKEAVKRLKWKYLVCLEGKEMSGKSSLGLYLLKTFSSKDYIPLILNCPEEYSHPSDEHYIIFIDDIFGSRKFSKEFATRWSKVIKDVIPEVRDGKMFLIVTSRDTFIDKSQTFANYDELTDTDNRIQLHHPQLVLRDYEKVGILEKLAIRLHFHEISNIIVKVASFSIPQWFLLCCKHIETKRVDPKEWPEIFKNPISLLHHRIVGLKDSDPIKLATLILIMKHDTNFSKQTPKIIEEDLKDLSPILHLPQDTTDVDLRIAAHAMVDTFLSKEGRTYRFLHNTARSAVCFVFWEMAPVYFINWCSLDFLINHTTTEHVNENSLQSIRIDKSLFQKLVTRFQRSYNVTMLQHSAFNDNDFVEVFFEDNPHAKNLARMAEMFCSGVSYGHCYLLQKTHGSVRTLDQYDEAQKVLFQIASSRGHVQVMNFFLKAGFVPDKSLFNTVCCSGHADEILEKFPKTALPSKVEEVMDDSLSALISSHSQMSVIKLIHSMTDQNNCKRLAISGMLKACEKGNFDMYSIFENALRNVSIDYSTMVPKAIKGGNTEILFHLMTKSKAMRKVVVSESSFLSACSHGKLQIAKLIWEKSNEYLRGAIFTHDGSDLMPLQHAAMVSDTDGMKLLTWLLATDLPVNASGPSGQTPLHSACGSGNFQAVIKLIEKGSDVRAVDDDGNTALHLQCSSDKPCKDIAEALLTAQANISALNKKKQTCLHLLCQKRHIARSTLLHYLISKMEDKNPLDTDRHTPLYLLLDTGFCQEELELLLENGANVNIEDNLKQTPLHAASRSNNCKAVEMILEKKGILGAQDKNGDLCLHHAVTAVNDTDVVEYLLQEKKMDINCRNFHGNTPLHVAVGVPHNKVVASKLLDLGADPSLTNKDGYTPVHLACVSNNKSALAIVKRLLDKGVSVNLRDTREKTALHLVCEESTKASLHIGRQLCERGAELDCTDNNGNTPLHLACFSLGDCRVRVIGLLVEWGAKVIISNHQHLSPIMVVQQAEDTTLFRLMIDSILTHACMSEAKYTTDDVTKVLAMEIPWSTMYQDSTPVLHRICSTHGEYSTAMVDKLLDKGIDIAATSKDGTTAIHSACMAVGPNTESLLTILVKSHGDIFARDTQGQTALHKAIKSTSDYTEGVLNQLQEFGLNANDPDGSENTPMHLVCSTGGAGTRRRIEWLLRNGADWKYMNNNGETPYDMAKNSPKRKQALMNEVLLKYCQDTEKLDEAMVSELLEKGADINCKNNQGNFILHLIVKKGKAFIEDNIKLLLSLRADVTKTNKRGQTPYEVALYKNMGEVILTLLCLPAGATGGKRNTDEGVGGTSLKDIAKNIVTGLAEIWISTVKKPE